MKINIKKHLAKIVLLSLLIVPFGGATTAKAAAPNWNTTGNYVVAFNYLSTDYAHDMSLTQDGLGGLIGNGGNPAGGPHIYTWVLTSGSVSGDTIDFLANYTASADAVTPQTTMHVVGTVALDGTMSGTWTDNYQGGAREGTWKTTSGKASAISTECNQSESQTIVSDTTTQDTTDATPAVAITPHPAWTSIAGATWVYNAPLDVNGSSPTGTKTFTRTFTISGTPIDSSLEIAADNMYTVSVNGHPLSTGTSATDLDNFSASKTWTIPAADLLSGSNTITFTITNPSVNPSDQTPFSDPNPAGLLYKLTINDNNCVVTPPVDICPNVTGAQTQGPCADTLCVEPATWNIDSQSCVAPQPTTGTISGMKYNDLNHNGKKDSNEPGLSGWVIRLLLDNPNNNNDTLITTATTDANGNYTFSNVAPGTYDVRETHQKGWKRMSKNPKDIVIVGGSVVTGVDFGNATIKKGEKEDTSNDDNRDDQSGKYYGNHGRSNYEKDQNQKDHQQSDGHGPHR